MDREAVSIAEDAGLDVKKFLNASLVAWVRGTDAAIGEHLRDHVLVPKRLVEPDSETISANLKRKTDQTPA